MDSCKNSITNDGHNSSVKEKSSSKTTEGTYNPRTAYDWESFDPFDPAHFSNYSQGVHLPVAMSNDISSKARLVNDIAECGLNPLAISADNGKAMKKHRVWKILENVLNCKDMPVLVILATISKEFHSGFILHEAISLGIPDNLLMLLADKFPNFLTQLDGNGRYPLHVAVFFGSSSEFIAHCIDKHPHSIDAEDIDGNTPAELFSQGTSTFFSVKSNPSAEKNRAYTLSILLCKASLTESTEGVSDI